MKAIRFKGHTSLFDPPREWDQAVYGPYAPLPVMIDEQNVHHTVWKPTFRERIMLLFGANIRLSVFNYQPAVHLELTLVSEVDAVAEYAKS